MRAQIAKTSAIPKTPRALQVAGLFDVPVDEKLTVHLDVTLPLDAKPWHVGLVTGPSGSGKSLLARHVWPDAFVAPSWDERTVVDNFPAGMGIKDVTGLLSAVGFGSTPAWLRPHSTLSNGEAFRADMARVLAETPPGDVSVVDEFTSFVDRQVARVASHAVQKSVRRSGRQLVAVTCHSDVIDWLQPDWVVELPSGKFTWRSVQPRPGLRLEVYAVDRAAWPLFERFHYLSPLLSNAAQCYGGWVDGELAVFSSYLHFPHAKIRDMKMAHRIVVLPDYQGLGLAGRISEWQGQYLHMQRLRYRIVTGHPAFLHYLRSSPRWRDVSTKTAFKVGPRSQMRARQLDPRRMITRSFEYAPPKRRDDH